MVLLRLRLQVLPVMLAAVQRLALCEGSCNTNLDCSLNGFCSRGSCVCSPPWHGPGCELMKFKPVVLPQGYGMRPNLTSWGGGAIFDIATKKYHSYISAMTNDCLLDTWTRNSRIEHGVADAVTGPYTFVDVAVPTWSHNAAPIALRDGTFAIVHIGGGTGAADGGQNCTCERAGNCPPPPPPPPCTARDSIPGYRCYRASCAAADPCTGTHCNCGDDIKEPKLASCHTKASCAAEAARACSADSACELFALRGENVKLFSNNSYPVANGDWTAYVRIGSPADLRLQQQQEGRPSESESEDSGSTIHVATTLAGPWRPLSPNTLGDCNNPAPWVHPNNGTIYIVCGNMMKRAEHISGPWTVVTTFSHAGGPAGAYEDPYLYTDQHGWHLLYHVYTTVETETCTNSTVSAHVFSEDGFAWHAHPISPYGTHIEVAGDDANIIVSTRERPKLFFNASGYMTHLFNGVCSAPACPGVAPCVNCKTHYWDYTLVAPLDV